MNHFNKNISCFKNCRTHELPKDVNLLVWLESRKYIDRLNILRKIEDKEVRDKYKKMHLPAVTISGLFATKKASSLITFSGLMALDIDNVDNLQAKKNKLQKLPYIAYCGLSCSGRGLWCIVPVTPDASNYEAHYNAIFEEMQGYNIKLDKLPDINRFRIFSYDSEAYFNQNAEIYTRTKHREKINSATTYCGSDTKYNQVLAQIEILASRGVDITEVYSNWIKIGAAFNNQFGENGRHLFHKISAINGGYNYEKCDKQYDKLAKMSRVSIATFFHLTKDYVL